MNFGFIQGTHAPPSPQYSVKQTGFLGVVEGHMTLSIFSEIIENHAVEHMLTGSIGMEHTQPNLPASAGYSRRVTACIECKRHKVLSIHRGDSSVANRRRCDAYCPAQKSPLVNVAWLGKPPACSRRTRPVLCRPLIIGLLTDICIRFGVADF